MTGNAIITYKGQTITLKNATITQLPSRNESNMTPEELDEAKRLLDAIIEKYPGEAYRAFNSQHSPAPQTAPSGYEHGYFTHAIILLHNY